MSLRVDTSPWISGALLVGDRGLGVLGSEVPSTGENGAGYLYNDLSLPTDAGKEVCGRITTWPTDGTLVAYEDSSFEFSGAADGSYTFAYQLYVDGVATGSPATVTLQVGSPDATFSITTGNAAFAGTAEVAGCTAQITVTTGNATASFMAQSGLFTQAQLDFLLAYMEANMAIPTAEEIAAAVLAAATAAGGIDSNLQQILGEPFGGSGTEADPWGP